MSKQGFIDSRMWIRCSAVTRNSFFRCYISRKIQNLG